MKRFLLLLLSSILLFVGCSESADKSISEQVGFSASPKSNGIKIFVTNKSEKEYLEIVWDKSIINNSPCFISGGKYVDAGKSQLNTVIRPKGTYNVTVYPADNVYYSDYYRDWIISELKYPTNISIALKMGEKVEYISKDVNSAEEELKKETKQGS